MKKKLLQGKLMKITPIRLSEELDLSISKLAQEIGESKQTVIRLAIKEGLNAVRNKLAGEQKGEGK